MRILFVLFEVLLLSDCILEDTYRDHLDLLLLFLDILLFVLLRPTSRVHDSPIGRELLLLWLVRCVQETTLSVRHVIELSRVRDVTRTIWNLESIELLAVHSIEVHVLTSTHEVVARGEIL